MTETETRVLAILTDHFGAIETPEADPLDAQFMRDLKPDSLDVIEVVMQLEDDLGAEITDDDVDGLLGDVTIRDIAAMIDGKLAKVAA